MDGATRNPTTSAASPYRINGPARISFSGGRTSAFMLHQIIQAHGGQLPDHIHVCFANTGKEREETLRFVHECGSRWNVKIHWIEWRDSKDGFEEVGFNSASRNGEPFEALIRKKGMPPNWQARFCTQFLKVVAMKAFAKSLSWEDGSYVEVIGLRHDEGGRLLKMYERNETEATKCIAPLSKAKITKRDVMAFWKAQPFDLALVPGESNCDLCMMKSMKTRMAIMRRFPDSAKWWMRMEQETSGFFDRHARYAELYRQVRDQGHLFDGFLDDTTMDDEEHDTECGLLCAPLESMETA